MNVAFFTLNPGPHAIHVVTATGFDATANVDLKTDDLAQMNGHSRWCVILGRRTSTPELRLLKKDDCQQLLNEAPGDDEANAAH